MKRTAIFIALSFLSFFAMAQRNVILIIADDLGTDYCGFYEDHADTAALPNIRRLVNRGVRFTNPMSNPVCSPTRAGILTGRYSFRTGVGEAVGGTGSPVIDTSEVTIPRVLKLFNTSIGTANIGKWHLSLQTPASNLLTPNWMGYDHYAGNFLGALTSYTSWTKVTDGITSTSTNYATTETASDAINWVKLQASNPFFLWLAYNAPHTPLHLPPAGLHSYTTLTGTAADINAYPKLYFKASLEALDHEIGRLLDSLEAFNKMDSTDIIFIGDNGNGLRSSQITDTNRAKGSIYQYGVKVPFIISGPSIVAPNRVANALVNTQDLFATIIELFGFTTWPTHIPTSKPVDSKSLIPILRNTDTVVRPWAFTEIFKVATDSLDGKAMRNLTYKLLNFDYNYQKFYNLSTDPTELYDLLGGTLSSTDVTNYYYLCNEMATLVGSTSFCSFMWRKFSNDVGYLPFKS
jgi:arylsulfatase A-like enzyme